MHGAPVEVRRSWPKAEEGGVFLHVEESSAPRLVYRTLQNTVFEGQSHAFLLRGSEDRSQRQVLRITRCTLRKPADIFYGGLVDWLADHFATADEAIDGWQ